MANFKLLSRLLHIGNDKNVKNFNQNSKVSLMRFKLGTPKYKDHISLLLLSGLINLITTYSTRTSYKMNVQQNK